MKGNLYYYAGVAAGIICGLLLVAIARKVREKRFGKCEYDERQELARGKAFRVGFLTLMVYSVVYGWLSDMTGFAWGTQFTCGIVAMCVGIGVFVVKCVWSDAYFSLRERPRRYALLFAAIVVMNLSNGLRDLHKGAQDRDMAVISLSVAITALVVLISIGAKAFYDRRHGELEEE